MAWALTARTIGVVFRRVSLTLASFCLAVAACGSSTTETAPDEPTASADGESSESGGVPELAGEFATISGGQIELNSLQGQDVILWFWAPW